MRGFVKSICLLALLTLVACARPVPPEKADYVGEWTGTAMTLLINQNGTVAYRRQKNGTSTSINGPLKEFQGDDFVVGIGLIATTFVVSVPPHLEGNVWKMTVDGVELTRMPGWHRLPGGSSA